MTELIKAINEIIKYGIQPNLAVPDKEKLLERHLVKIYDLYFDIEYKFDESIFPDFDNSQLPNIRQNLESNFKDYGLYKTVLDVSDLDNVEDNAIGDAIDDLTDIIIDLLEIKAKLLSRFSKYSLNLLSTNNSGNTFWGIIFFRERSRTTKPIT